MNNVERIKAEIERQIKDYRLSRSAEGKYRYEAYRELLTFIDSLKTEPVSENLKDMAERYATNIEKQCYNLTAYDKELIVDTFKTGAYWQKVELYNEETFSDDFDEEFDHFIYCQMDTIRDNVRHFIRWTRERLMENAISCRICWHDGFYPDFSEEQLNDVIKEQGIHVGDKVKVLIFKED